MSTEGFQNISNCTAIFGPLSPPKKQTTQLKRVGISELMQMGKQENRPS
jgi:hypothetical protein